VLIHYTTYIDGETVVCSLVSIATSSDVVVSLGSDVTYRAPEVALNPWFRVEEGARFRIGPSP
jgi:hypothetical protein